MFHHWLCWSRLDHWLYGHGRFDCKLFDDCSLLDHWWLHSWGLFDYWRLKFGNSRLKNSRLFGHWCFGYLLDGSRVFGHWCFGNLLNGSRLFCQSRMLGHRSFG